MSTFVPLAGDTEGTLSAVTIGDWVLQVVRDRSPEGTEAFYGAFVNNFTLDEETGEQRLTDPMCLFNLLMSKAGTVLGLLQEARETGEMEVVVTFQHSGTQKESRVTKTYLEFSREVEEYFTVLLYIIVHRFTDPHEAGKAIGVICAELQGSTTLPEFRLSVLFATYNAFEPKFLYRFPIFVAILEYATETKQFNVMLPYIKYIEEWTADWDINLVARRQLYLIVATQLRKLSKDKEAYAFLRQHVDTFQGEMAAVLSDPATIGVAVDLVEESLRLSEVVNLDSIAELDAVKYLSNTEWGGLVELIEILLGGGPSDLDKFAQLNPHYFAKGLQLEELKSKLNILNLISAVGQCKAVDLGELATSLQLDRDHVERVAVATLSRGLIDGRIDQQSNSLIVNGVIARRFTRSCWVTLRKRLIEKQAVVTKMVHIYKNAVDLPGAPSRGITGATGSPGGSGDPDEGRHHDFTRSNGTGEKKVEFANRNFFGRRPPVKNGNGPFETRRPSSGQGKAEESDNWRA